MAAAEDRDGFEEMTEATALLLSAELRREAPPDSC